MWSSNGSFCATGIGRQGTYFKLVGDLEATVVHTRTHMVDGSGPHVACERHRYCHVCTHKRLLSRPAGLAPSRSLALEASARADARSQPRVEEVSRRPWTVSPQAHGSPASRASLKVFWEARANLTSRLSQGCGLCWRPGCDWDDELPGGSHIKAATTCNDCDSSLDLARYRTGGSLPTGPRPACGRPPLAPPPFPPQPFS